MLSGKNRKAMRSPAVPGSRRKAMSAPVASCHLLFIAIEPDLSKVMNMLTGASVAVADATAQAASGSTMPLPPAPPDPTAASGTTMPLPELPVVVAEVEALMFSPPAPTVAPPPPEVVPVLNDEPLSAAEHANEGARPNASRATRSVRIRRFTLHLRCATVWPELVVPIHKTVWKMGTRTTGGRFRLFVPCTIDLLSPAPSLRRCIW